MVSKNWHLQIGQWAVLDAECPGLAGIIDWLVAYISGITFALGNGIMNLILMDDSWDS